MRETHLTIGRQREKEPRIERYRASILDERKLYDVSTLHHITRHTLYSSSF